VTASREAVRVLLAALFLGGVVTIAGILDSGDGEGGPVDPTAEVLEDSASGPAVAARTVDRVHLFRDGGGDSRLVLTSAEVSAVLRHAAPGVVPAGVTDPRVRFSDGTVFVEARLVADDFEETARIVTALGVVSDTIDVLLEGRLTPGHDRLLFVIDQARAARIPLPSGVVRAIALSMNGSVDPEGSQAGETQAALGVRWPDRVDRIEVVGDRLVLVRSERIADRAVDGSDLP